MKYFGVHRTSSYFNAKRKIPLNSVILPPLTPELAPDEAEIIANVVVNKSKSGDIVTVTRSQDVMSRNSEAQRDPESSRVAQLEQNIRFLQEQHQLMLTGLHNEVENLRNQNRELQFQLIFAKGSIPSSPSSSEDDTKYKIYSSPKPANVIPLQVEILEKELKELKLQLQEADNSSVYLSAVVDEQKKKLEAFEREQAQEQTDQELLQKLEDAEAVIRRLRRENSDLRKENSQYHPKESNNYQSREQYPPQRSTGSGRNHRRGNSSNHYRNNWFPPLHTQNYWSNTRGNDRENHSTGSFDSASLPSISAATGGENGQFQNRRHSNNNRYRSGDGKKHRGNQNKPKPL